MCRKFGWLRNRVLLYRQDELSRLERKLLSMDDEDKEEYAEALQSRKKDDGREDINYECSRQKLIQDIDDKLKQYGKYILPESLKSLYLNHSRQSGFTDQVLHFSENAIFSEL